MTWTYCRGSWCAVWYHLQWPTALAGSRQSARQQPVDRRPFELMSTWLSDPLTRTKTNTVRSKYPWNSLRSSRSHIILLQAEGESTCRWLDSRAPRGPHRLFGSLGAENRILPGWRTTYLLVVIYSYFRLGIFSGSTSTSNQRPRSNKFVYDLQTEESNSLWQSQHVSKHSDIF